MMSEDQFPSYALPRLDELTRPWDAPSWLKSQFRELGMSDKIYRRYAAMGLVGYRFFPDNPRDLEVFEHHADMIEKRIMEWLMQQPPEDLKQVSHEAEVEALGLAEELDKLMKNRWPTHALMLVALAREILEDVTMLLKRRGYASRVAPILDLLDQEANKRIPFDQLSPPTFRPQLLLAVRQQTPKKWWGRVLGSFS